MIKSETYVVSHAVGINERLPVSIARKSIRNVNRRTIATIQMIAAPAGLYNIVTCFPSDLWRDELSFGHLSLEPFVRVVLREYHKLGSFLRRQSDAGTAQYSTYRRDSKTSLYLKRLQI